MSGHYELRGEHGPEILNFDSDALKPVPYDPANPDAELPELPPGWRYEITITAEADVVHADGTKN